MAESDSDGGQGADPGARPHDRGHDHGHHHDHPHDHDHQVVPDDIALRVRALESILVDKQMVDPAALDEVVDAYENRIGPRNGAQVVARAWSDPAYKARLLDDGTAAIAELGFGGAQGEHMVVVENTPEVHNLVVCTLCSCYPWPTLGLPPVWYKSNAYRARTSSPGRKRGATSTASRPGHTRLPRYARGKAGVVTRDNGVYAVQDTDEAGRALDRPPQHVYTVRFAARDLWGERASARDAVYADLWEDHLEPA
jgi:hypothetical protein